MLGAQTVPGNVPCRVPRLCRVPVPHRLPELCQELILCHIPMPCHPPGPHRVPLPCPLPTPRHIPMPCPTPRPHRALVPCQVPMPCHATSPCHTTHPDHTRCRYPASCPRCATPHAYTAPAHLEQEVVLEDPLDGLEQVGAEGQRVPQPLLALAEEPSLRLAPHALGQRRHRAAGRERAQPPARPAARPRAPHSPGVVVAVLGVDGKLLALRAGGSAVRARHGPHAPPPSPVPPRGARSYPGDEADGHGHGIAGAALQVLQQGAGGGGQQRGRGDSSPTTITTTTAGWGGTDRVPSGTTHLLSS